MGVCERPSLSCQHVLRAYYRKSYEINSRKSLGSVSPLWFFFLLGIFRIIDRYIVGYETPIGKIDDAQSSSHAKGGSGRYAVGVASR